MRNRRLPVVGLAVVALALTAGCSRSDRDAPGAGQPALAASAEPSVEETAEETDPATPAELPDACALVSKAEAEKLAGTPLNDPRPIRETCTYTAPVSGPTAQVEVFVGDGVTKYLDIERTLGHELRPLSGLGDEAYLSFEAFFINKAGVWVAVRLVRLNDPKENRKPLEQLARTVAGRM